MLAVQVVLGSWCWYFCSSLRVLELVVRMVRGLWCWCGRLSWYKFLSSCGVLVPVVFEVTLGVLVFGGHRRHEIPSPSLFVVLLLFV